MSSFLITGTNRGIGLELVKLLGALPPTQVGTIVATARGASPSAALSEAMQASGGRAKYVQLDVTDETSVSDAARQTSEIVGGSGLDVLINNAGILPKEPGGVAKMDKLTETLLTNVVAVQAVSSAFLPLLRQSRGKKIINISSTMGSITLAKYLAGSPTPSYKTSKAALNMLTTQFALELGKEGFTVVGLSPGWLKTDGGGANADLEPEQGAKATLDIILSSKPEDSGRFRDIYISGDERYTGKDAPW